eukprot:11157500-Lingulodinium_polyedra.AAC.1
MVASAPCHGLLCGVRVSAARCFEGWCILTVFLPSLNVVLERYVGGSPVPARATVTSPLTWKLL